MDIVKAAELVNTVPECICAPPVEAGLFVTPGCPIHAPTIYTQQDIDDESGVGTEPAE